jgi:hypothetical protein
MAASLGITLVELYIERLEVFTSGVRRPHEGPMSADAVG